MGYGVGTKGEGRLGSSVSLVLEMELVKFVRKSDPYKHNIVNVRL